MSKNKVERRCLVMHMQICAGQMYKSAQLNLCNGLLLASHTFLCVAVYPDHTLWLIWG